MKKKFSIVLMIMSLAFSAFALTACGHTHDYKETVLDDGSNLATEATCTESATYYKVCQCGEVHDTETFEYGSTLPHDYQEIVADGATNLVTPATCIDLAVYKKVCADCGIAHETETFTSGTVDGANHVGFDNEVIDDTYLVTGGEANHEHGTRYYKSCDCGVAHETEYFEDDDVIPHTFDQEVIVAEALKESANHEHGNIYFLSCSCGAISTNETEIFEDEASIVPHTFDQEVISPDALKEEANHDHGNIYFLSCSCGAISTNETEIFEDEASVIPHEWEEVVDAQFKVAGSVPTHEHGTEYYKSCDCGAVSDETFYDSADIIPHTFDQEVISPDALKEEANHDHGNIYYLSCECGAISTNETEIFEDEASKIPHVYDQQVKDVSRIKEVANHAHGTIYYLSCSCGAVSLTETFEDTADKVVYELDAIKTYLDDSNANVTFDLTYLESTYGVTLSGVTITYGGIELNTYTLDGGIITVAEADLKATNGKQLSGVTEVSIIATGNGEEVLTFNAKATLTIVTNLITTADEFLNMKNEMIADYQGVGTTSGTDLKRYGGYFELGNDIDLNGATYQSFHRWYSSVNTVVDGAAGWSATGGFVGTFDGQGHTVANFKISSLQGVFGGVIGAKGVVKNVAFINAGFVETSSSTILTQNLFGTVENVYIQTPQLVQGTQQNGSALVAFNIYAGATVKNVFAEVDSLNYTPGELGIRDTDTTDYANDNWVNVIGNVAGGLDKISNVIAITAGEAVLNDQTVENAVTVTGAGDVNLDAGRAIAGFPTREILKQNLALVSPVFSLLDKNYWAVADDGMLVWKSLLIPESATIVGKIALETETEINVANAGLSNNTITWSSANEGVTFDGNKVTIAESVGASTTVTLVATNRFGASKAFEVTTYQTTFDTAEEFNISLLQLGDEVVIPHTAVGDVESITFDGAPVETFEYVNGESVTIAKSVFASSLKKANLIVVAKDGDNYTNTTIPLDIATMIIEDEADLNQFPTLAATVKNGDAWGAGLYVLDADITCAGNYVNTNQDADNGYSAGSRGFGGTFDGRNHVIKNINVGGNGFIAGLAGGGANGGKLINVAFANATYSSANFLGINNGGYVNNVYVQATAINAGNTGIFKDNFGCARIQNFVAEYVGGNGTYYLQGTNANVGYSSFVANVYAVGVNTANNGGVANAVGGTAKTDAIGAFATFDEMKSATTGVYGYAIDYTTMDNDFWDIVNGMPVPASIANAQTEFEILNDATAIVPVESKVAINVPANVYVKYELAEAVDGVTINGNVVSVTTAAQGKTFTVKVTAQASEEVATKTFTVQAVEVVELATSKDINLGVEDATTTTVDCSDFLNEKSVADNEITGVTLNGNNLEYTVENGVLSITKAPLNVEANLGEQSLIVTAETDAGVYTFKQPVVVCSLIISSKADADRMFECSIATNDDTRKSRTGYFILGANVDMEDTAIGIGYYGTDASQGLTTNGNVNSCYRATFDGRGYTLSNVKYTKNAQALFGATAYNCTIKNLKMTNVDVATTTGALYSTVNGTTSATNVYIEGKFTKYQNSSWGPVAFCASKVDSWTGSFTNVYAVLTSHVTTVAAQGDAVVKDYTGVLIGTTSAATGHLVNCAALDLQAYGDGEAKIKLAPADTISTAVNTSLVYSKADALALTGHSGSAWDAFQAYCTPAQAE